MYEYTLRKARDVDFFSSPHYDAVSTALIKDGDTICICDRCGEIHLQSSWEANDKQCVSCEGKKRKNFDEEYLHRYRVTTAKGNGRGRAGAFSGQVLRRTTAVVGAYKSAGSQVIPGRRRPSSNTADRSSNSTSIISVDSDRLLADSRRQVNTAIEPRAKAERKKAGKILLGLAIAAIVITAIVLIGNFA